MITNQIIENFVVVKEIFSLQAQIDHSRNKAATTSSYWNDKNNRNNNNKVGTPNLKIENICP